MASHSTSAVVHHLRRAVLLRDGAGIPDGQLLESFIQHQDDAAFEALVRRHGPMVLGVCRRILHHPHDVEDAFQATFLVLVRKATSIVPRARVGSWLFGVARMTARRARAARATRQTRERPVSTLPEPASARRDDPWHDWLPLLDAELERLPEKYRLPIVLCDLENQPIKETARQLGWPQGTLAGRLARARTLLAKRLRRHGSTLSGGALAGVLSANAASAATPYTLVSLTVKAASVFAARKATVDLSANVAALTEGVVRTMFLKKIKIVALGVILVAALSMGAAMYPARTAGAEPPAAQPVPSQPRAQEKVKTSRMSYQLEPVLLSAAEPPLKPKVLACPRCVVFEAQPAEIKIGEETVPQSDDIQGQEMLLAGTSFRFTVKRPRASQSLLLDITFDDTHLDCNDADGYVVTGNTLHAVRKIELDKKEEFVVARDAKGNPQRWVELTVRKVDLEGLPVAVPPPAPAPAIVPGRIYPEPASLQKPQAPKE
jgi:RNA polymerase sigma factor (sigma-70 family)